jgi:capsular polysaccharide biosynthesis protein
MESPDVLLSVIKDLGLDKAWAKRVYAADSDELPDVDALTHMRNILKIDLIRGTNIIKITASSDTPKEAADIANAIVDQYKTIRDGEENQRLGQGLTESSVRVLTRAEIPEVPTKPNRRFNFIVTILAACFLSITVASFNEVILLLSRASERTDN